MAQVRPLMSVYLHSPFLHSPEALWTLNINADVAMTQTRLVKHRYGSGHVFGRPSDVVMTFVVERRTKHFSVD